MTKPTQLIPLAALILAVSCSRPDPDMDKPWNAVRLPTAAHFKTMEPDGWQSLTITVSPSGELGLSGVTVSQSEFRTIALRRFRNYGVFTSTLYVDSNARFETFWSPIRQLREMGMWRFRFAAIKKSQRKSPLIGEVLIAAPVEENDPDHKGPVMLQSTADGKMPLPIVRFLPTGLELNGSAVSLAQLDRHLQEHVATLKVRTIVLIPSPKTTYSEIVAVLDLCAKHGLNNIAIMEDLHAEPSGPPYPEAEPAEVTEV